MVNKAQQCVCECRENCSCNERGTRYKQSGGGEAVYGLGMIGAVVYYIATASGFWVGVLGVFKAIIWPAFLVYELMKMLGM